MSCGSNSDETDVEVSNWTKSPRQPVESNCHLSECSSEMKGTEELDVGGSGLMVQQVSTEKGQSFCRKKDTIKMENSEVGFEEVGVGRGITRRKCRSLMSGQKGYSEGQGCDYYSSIKSVDTALIHCGKDTCNSAVYSSSNCQECNSQSVSKKEESNTTQSVACEDRRQVYFTHNFLDEVGVGRGITRRDYKSSSPGSTSGHSSQNSLTLVTDSDNQVWNYYSEIKNAINSSQDKICSCKMDTQKPSEHNITCESGFVDTCLDVSLSQEDSNSTVKSSDSNDQFQDFSDTAHESKFIKYLDGEVGDVHCDTSSLSLVGREEHVGSSLDSVCSENIFVSDECYKKDENDECRVQEEQNWKNRRTMRSNVMSDVLIISDPLSDVTPPSTQMDSNSENSLLSSGFINKKKKVQHKGENIIMEIEGLPLTTQSPDMQKSSPASDLVSPSLNPDECTWDMMFDDNGECLDPKLMEEVSISYLV